MGGFIKRIRESKAGRLIDKGLSSYFFPMVNAAVVLLCYYLGLDVVTILYICLCGAAILFFCDDVTPVISLLLFMNVMVSVKHSPSDIGGASSDYFTRPAVLAFVIIGVLIFAGVLVVRLVLSVKRGNFKVTPMFGGVCVFSAALLFNGLFNLEYSPMNLLYGFALAAVICGVFVFISGNVKVDKSTFVKISYYLVALFAVVLIELIVAYITTDGLIVDGKVMRGKLFFGWGMYNNMGVLLTMTIPAWFYLAGKYKYGLTFIAGGFANLAASVMCMSRQAMLMSAVLFAVCYICYLIWVKGKTRIIAICIMVGALAVVGIALGVMHEKVGTFFSALVDNFKDGSGRTDLWKKGIKNFLNNPIFGTGFYNPSAKPGEPGYSGTTISYSIPRMCHNTFIQLLCAGGAVAFIAYLVHRVQTIKSYVKNINPERTFIVLVAGGILLTSLLDNHLFYILPTLSYAVLIALLSITEGKKKEGGSGKQEEEL